MSPEKNKYSSHLIWFDQREKLKRIEGSCSMAKVHVTQPHEEGGEGKNNRIIAHPRQWPPSNLLRLTLSPLLSVPQKKNKKNTHTSSEACYTPTHMVWWCCWCWHIFVLWDKSCFIGTDYSFILRLLTPANITLHTNALQRAGRDRRKEGEERTRQWIKDGKKKKASGAVLYREREMDVTQVYIVFREKKMIL